MQTSIPVSIAGTGHRRYHNFGTLLNVRWMYNPHVHGIQTGAPRFCVVYARTYISHHTKNAPNAEFVNI